MHYNKGLAVLTIAVILTSCGQTPLPALVASEASSSGKLRTLNVAPGPTIGIVGSISASREVTKNTTTDYKWELTKTADPTFFGTDSAKFTVTATLKKTVGGPTATGTKTVVQNQAGNTVQVCNLSTSILDVSSVDAAVVGFDGTGTTLPQSINLSGLFAMPFSLNPAGLPGDCISVAYMLNTSDPVHSVPALSAADVTFLNTASEFQLRVSAIGTLQGGGTATGQAETPKVTPTLTTKDTTSETGDKTVKLTDPLFSYSQDITQTTSTGFTRKFTCQDKTGLVQVPGTIDQYTFTNTAYLKGASTDLKASDIAKITVKCSPGCTYTQGYFKNHAQYRYLSGNLILNKQYDQSAWKGTYNWNGEISKLMIGDKAYTQQQIFNIYQMSVSGNFAIALFHQYATVLLNSIKATNPVDTSSISAEIAAAEAFFKVNSGFLNSSFVSSTTVTLGGKTYTLSQLNDAFSLFNESRHCAE